MFGASGGACGAVSLRGVDCEKIREILPANLGVPSGNLFMIADSEYQKLVMRRTT